MIQGIKRRMTHIYVVMTARYDQEAYTVARKMQLKPQYFPVNFTSVPVRHSIPWDRPVLCFEATPWKKMIFRTRVFLKTGSVIPVGRDRGSFLTCSMRQRPDLE